MMSWRRDYDLERLDNAGRCDSGRSGLCLFDVSGVGSERDASEKEAGVGGSNGEVEEGLRWKRMSFGKY